MESYAGFEPQVGELRAVRSFRVGPGGVLYPLFSNVPWDSGANEAHCRVRRIPSGDFLDHAVPGSDCTCGFYAYSSELNATEYPNARYVLAVIACWGRVIAGTRGLRAQHARIEALWMSPKVPSDLAVQVASRYPDVQLYADQQLMLTEHPPTRLACYETPTPAERSVRRVGFRLGLLLAVVVGVLPAGLLGGVTQARLIWAGGLLAVVVAMLVARRKRTDLAARRRSMFLGAAALWLMAPLAGTAGLLLLRLPLVQIGALSMLQRHLLIRSAGRFPAEIG